MTKLGQCMRGPQGLIALLLVVATAACDVNVDEGNSLQTLRITDLAVLGISDAGLELEETDQANRSTADAFRCFRSSLVLLGTFTDRARENMTQRASWSSSNPDAVRVSNGDEPIATLDPDGNLVEAFLAKGVLTPVGPPGSTATITARFLSLTASVDVTVRPSRLEISPPISSLAAGTEQPLVLTGVLDQRRALGASSLVRWSLTAQGAAQAQIDLELNRLRALGSNNSPNDIVTLRADPLIVGCEDFVATSQIKVVDRTFNRLELRTENFGIDPEPFELQQSTREAARVFGIFDGDNNADYYEQDLTLQLIFDQLDALRAELPEGEERQLILESEDPDDADAPAGPAGFLLSDKVVVFTDSLAEGEDRDTSRMLIHYDQRDDDAFVLEHEFLVDVIGDELLDMSIAPSASEVFPGTIARLKAQARYDDGLGNDDSIKVQDITRSVSWNSSDTEVANVSSLGGFQGLVTTALDAMGTTTIDVERVDPGTGDTVAASDSGGEASLSVGNVPLGSLTIEPADAVVPLEGKLQLRLIGDNGQDLTESAIWSSDMPAVVGIDNVVPRNGLIYGVSDSNGPVTITARLFIRNEDETTDLTATTSVSVGPAQPPTPNPPPGGGGGGGDECSVIDQILGNC